MNMNFNDIFIVITFIITTLILIILINTLLPEDQKKQNFLKNLPNKKIKIIEKIVEKEDIHNFILDLTIANGMKNDSVDDFVKDITKGSLVGTIIFIVTMFFGGKIVIGGLCLFIFLTTFPILKRKSLKKSFKRQYISDFYVFLNYITLYLSGGIEMRTALIEIMKITPKKSTIYERIQNMINKNAISGFSGNTYIATLDELNNNLDFPEITTFINSAKRSQARGDSIADTLLIQINDITKKSEMDKRSYIIQQESTFGVFKVGLCFTPMVLTIIIPVFVSAMNMM